MENYAKSTVSDSLQNVKVVIISEKDFRDRAKMATFAPQTSQESVCNHALVPENIIRGLKVFRTRQIAFVALVEKVKHEV